METKVIHFYIDKISVDDNLWDDIILTHNETMEKIKEGYFHIDTLAISALYFGDLLDKGYNVYLHENNKMMEIKEGNIVATDKVIRKGHDVRKLWIAGTFNDYFYGEK